ncbi:sensor histidine kinase [Aquiflexum sp.]|uniref:sensor histidine kinase n=1 Tax=Aquiflexum sp. TaxID=1872584 RepID=UPI00359417A9
MVDLTSHPAFVLIREAKQRGDDFFVSFVEGEQIAEMYQLLNSFANKGQFQKILDSGFQFPTHQFNHIVFGAQVSLLFVTYEACPEGWDIFKRFGKVFEQTYTRFLDLEKAEAQAKEAQIETALEKVRSTSLAMHKAEELKNVVSVVFQKLKELGLTFDVAGIRLYAEGSKDIVQWVAAPDLLSAPVLAYLPFVEKDYLESEMLKDVWQAKEMGKSFFNRHYSFEEKNKFFQYAGRHNDITAMPKDVREFQLKAPEYTLSIVAEKRSALWVDSYSGQTITSEAIDILKRFSRVFEQTYIRFLDLQKAEAQAREAQVEVALERIRGRALAMQSSSELTEVVKVLRDQMGILGHQDLEASVVHLYSEGSPTFDSWYAFRAGAQIIEGSATFRLENSALAKEFLELYIDDVTEYTIEVKGKKLEEWLTEIKSNAPKIAAYWGDLPPEKQFYHFSDFSGGALLMVSYEKLTEETRMLQKRCASVFELAYKRFLDLQAKETHEKELLEEKQRLEQALSELKATQAQLIQSEKMASLGELTAGIAHEIQNPLNFVNNFSEVSSELVDEIQEERTKNQGLRQSSGSELTAEEKLENEILQDIKQNLDKITLHGKRADAIVKGMLEHSRANKGEKSPTNLNTLADEFVRLSYHGLRAKNKSFNAEFTLNLDPDLPKVNVAAADIGRVILNLVNNAFYAVHEKAKSGVKDYKPEVIVSSMKTEKGIELSVQDNGSGIPEHIKEKIFQPFFTTKPTGSGTGLGLSLSYDIVKAHGGEIKVKTKEGEGTDFQILLPFIK